ncbi:Anaphase-promoting complex subunit [Thalictrum thalictroides]|uniref:Anaphase-promoting complex subunit 5 n=1 Tax=Thalictrum thalictroides TaxID=46969 RepID=A0A7J6VYX6_THATH|nr:Anaphase-promoting complex subunit [Thalictrum thalictroides]
MAGKSIGGFVITPHKVSICILLQVYAPPAQVLVPFPFSSVSQHNRLGLFLLSLTKSYDDILEPKLDELTNQLDEIGGGVLNHWLSDHLINNISSIKLPDDLFNLFSTLRGTLGGGPETGIEDEQIILDHNSQLGMFLRRCLLAFNQLSFEGVCHLLTNIGTYYKEDPPSRGADDLPDEDDSNNDLEELMDCEDMDLEPFVSEKISEEIEAQARAREGSPFHIHAPRSILGQVEDMPNSSGVMHHDVCIQDVEFVHQPNDALRDDQGQHGVFLRTNWQVQGYLREQADLIEKHASSFPLNAFESTLKQLQKMAPELRRVHYLRYLNNLYHDDYPASTESLCSYFDYSFPSHCPCKRIPLDSLEACCYSFPEQTFSEPTSRSILVRLESPRTMRANSEAAAFVPFPAGLYCFLIAPKEPQSDQKMRFDGVEGVIAPSITPSMDFGRYEIALLCLGMMHCHFGHPKQALKVLTEAVQVSQKNNDDACLSYTLTAICNLLSETGISSATGIIGSSYSPVTSFASSLAIQQQLLVLLTRSLKRAETLKLTRLVASNRLTMAKFDLSHVKRPLLSFGPKSSTKLRTCPSDVFKELRLSPFLLSEFGLDGASVTIDGAFSTAWLKNLRKPMASLILLQENEYGSGSESLHFGGQPSPIPGSVLQLSGSSYLLRATAWELYGSSPLARLNALIHATCFTDASSSADVELAYVKLIQHLSIFRGHKEAFTALKVAEGKFLGFTKSRIQILKLQLLHDHALHRGQLKLAQRVCDELGALASSVSGVDLEVKTEACLRHARTLLAANQFSQAASVAHSLFCMCYKFNLQVENATSLLLLAEIHKKSGNAVLGLPYALASLSFCQSFNLDLLEASATLALAELWLSLGSNHAKRASTLIHRALPMIFGHGGLELQARANIAVAKCYLSDSSFSASEDFEAILDPLRQASEDLEVLEYHELAAEAFYLMANVFNNLGQFDEREKAATSFKRHVLALENAEYEEDPLSTET